MSSSFIRPWIAAVLVLINCFMVPTLADDAPVKSAQSGTAEENGDAVKESTASTSLVIAEDLEVPEAFDHPVPRGLDELQAMERHVRMLSEKLRACTVSVQIGNSQGSGVIVTEDGYILTCAHVIGRPGRRCTVIFPDGKEVRGETLGSNEMLDAGMIRITATKPDGGWPHANMAAFDSIEVGDWCLATGHPGGFRDDRPPVVRLGRVVFRTPRILQSDCELVGGDSGGPLFDMRGRVIAINSRIQDDATANYHVPISAYRGGWERMVAKEVFSSHSGALLGVSGKPVAAGVEVTRVFPGEPADVAGLLAGDVIVTFNSRRVPSLARLTELVGEENPGALVLLEILREGKPMDIKVRLGMRWD